MTLGKHCLVCLTEDTYSRIPKRYSSFICFAITSAQSWRLDVYVKKYIYTLGELWTGIQCNDLFHASSQLQPMPLPWPQPRINRSMPVGHGGSYAEEETTPWATSGAFSDLKGQVWRSQLHRKTCTREERRFICRLGRSHYLVGALRSRIAPYFVAAVT